MGILEGLYVHMGILEGLYVWAYLRSVHMGILEGLYIWAYLKVCTYIYGYS